MPEWLSVCMHAMHARYGGAVPTIYRCAPTESGSLPAPASGMARYHGQVVGPYLVNLSQTPFIWLQCSTRLQHVCQSLLGCLPEGCGGVHVRSHVFHRSASPVSFYLQRSRELLTPGDLHDLIHGLSVQMEMGESETIVLQLKMSSAHLRDVSERVSCPRAHTHMNTLTHTHTHTNIISVEPHL